MRTASPTIAGLGQALRIFAEGEQPEKGGTQAAVELRQEAAVTQIVLHPRLWFQRGIEPLPYQMVVERLQVEVRYFGGRNGLCLREDVPEAAAECVVFAGRDAPPDVCPVHRRSIYR